MTRYLIAVALAATAALAPAQTLPGTVVPAPCDPPGFSAPMPTAPTVGPVGIDCNGRATGCPTNCGRTTGLLKWLVGSNDCGPTCDTVSRRPLIHIELNIGSSACATEKCKTGRTKPDRPCLTRLTEWLCYHPDYCRTIPVFRPTPCQAPLLAYFPCHEPKNPGCGGCGHCAACKHGPRLPDGHRLSSALDFLRPDGKLFGRHCAACGDVGWDGDCPGGCKPAHLRYACPLGVPAGKADPSTGGIAPPADNVPGGVPAAVAPAKYEQPADARPLAARPFTRR